MLMNEIRRAGPLLLAVVLVLGGCASSGGQDGRSGELRKASPQANRAFVQARTAWAKTYAGATDDVTRTQNLYRVIRKLEDAAVIEPKNPLIQSKIGDVYVELGDVPNAMKHHGKAVALCPDWTPSWLGFGHCAVLMEEYAEADRVLQAVEESLESLRLWGEPEPPGFFETFLSAFGITIPRDEPRRKAVADPGLDPQAARQLAYAWLEESLDWSPANAELLGGSASSARSFEKRYVSRAWCLRAVIADSGGIVLPEGRTRVSVVDEYLDRALDFDSDNFHARLFKAQRQLALGRHDVARALVEPYRDESNPMLANHGLLMVTLLHALAGTYIDRPCEETLEAAAGVAQWIEKYHGRFEAPIFRLTQSWLIARARSDLPTLERVTKSLADTDWNDRYSQRLADGLVDRFEANPPSRNLAVTGSRR